MIRWLYWLIASLPCTVAGQTLRPTTLDIRFPGSEVNMLSFAESGKIGFISGSNDWEQQLPYLVHKGESMTLERIEALDTVYNGAISPSGRQILFSRRGGEYTEFFLTRKTKEGWSPPVNLSKDSGLTGGYFNWVTEKDIYFYVPDQQGDIVRGKLKKGRLALVELLSAVNTEHVEFSPFVDKKKRYLLFTRYAENDASQQGLMISRNVGTRKRPLWDTPKKLVGLPYGWGAFVQDGVLYYSDGVQILSLPTSVLGL